MSKPLIYDMMGIESELAALAPNRGLYFACSCVERLLPVASLWSANIAADVRQTLDEAWLLTSEDLPAVESSLIKSLEDALDSLTKNRNARPKLLMYMADPAIPACYFFLKYLSNLDTDSILRCSEYAYDAAWTLSQELVLTIPAQRDVVELINSTRLVQDELYKQQQDVEQLRKTLLTDESIQQIRLGAQKTGRVLVAQVQQYLQADAANWVSTKSAYLIGTKVEGDVVYTHPKGVILKLNKNAFALAPMTEPHINEQMFTLRLQVDKIIGVVAGYDEDDRFVILKLVEIYTG